jgi:transposase
MIQILTRRLTNQVALSRHPLEPISELAVGRCGRGMIRGHDRPGSQARPRRAVGDRGAAAPAATPKPSRRPTAQRARPQLSGRDHLRDPRLHPLGAAARRRAWRGSYATCWRRFSEWAAAGVFETLHLVLLDRLGEQAWWTGRGCWWTRPACGPNGGDHVGANPVDRGKPGSKLHLATDAKGLPLAMLVSAANVNDCVLFEALVEEVPPVRTPAGRRRCRPERVHADKAYDHRRCRRYLARRKITARIARRGIESSTRLGRHRWRVERSFAWLGCYRRLGMRWDRCSGRFYAFAEVACALVCFKALQRALSGWRKPLRSTLVWPPLPDATSAKWSGGLGIIVDGARPPRQSAP